MYESYDAFVDHVELLSHLDQIRFIAELTIRTEPDAYRLFSRAHVWVVEGHKETENMGAIEDLISSAFAYVDPRFKVGILRSSYSVRCCLKNWHNLRDNAHWHLKQTETPERARKLMAGLYSEFRTTKLFPRFTPRHSLWQNYPQEHLWPRPNWRHA